MNKEKIELIYTDVFGCSHKVSFETDTMMTDQVVEWFTNQALTAIGFHVKTDED